MKQYGLIGHPLTHSFSKTYFLNKFKQEEIHDASFENYDLVSVDQILQLIKENTSLKGLCVTIPYKQSVIGFLDQQDETVTQIGACNSIKISEGKLIGYNTDVTGFKKSLLSKLKSNHTKALILGTGGSAKAVAYVLRNLSIDHLHVSRSGLGSNTVSYANVDEAILSDHLLIINCTPVGMFPNVDQAPNIPYQYLTSEHFLFDLTYNPEKSLFLKKGESKSCIIQNGFDMLIYQAEASWDIWNSTK